MLISIEPNITCDFPGGGGPDPFPPSGSAHEQRSKLIETGVLICGQTNMHMQSFKKANI